ncbi:MAG: DUF4097 family beta strand repeat protein [Planctomycetes bacterium]|nr:DUF4097 family beta strand repeat protein [Planctomycetota bacterium]
MKRVLIPVAAAAACLFCGFALAAGCVISNGIDFVTSIGAQEHVARNETHALKLAEGGRLEVDLSYGAVVVRADTAGAPELAAVITGYGKDVEAAQKALDGTRLDVEEVAGGVRIRLSGPTVESRRSGIVTGSGPRADLELRIPRDVALAMDLGSGNIETHGPIGPSKLKSDYGDVKVDSARGDLRMESSSGAIALGELKAAKSFVGRSDYGNVSARSVEADVVELHTSSGSVHLEDAACSRATLESNYGKIVALRVAGDLVARTDSGTVEAEDLTGKTASLKSAYGSIVVRRFRGELTANTSSGHVKVSEFEGACSLHSDYGNVDAEGRLDRFEGKTSSGSVNVKALVGSTIANDWRLASGYGNVSLALPRELGFTLKAKTDYGNLDIQLPVTIAAGGLKKKEALQGQVGAGGRTVTLETSSGNVRVAPID